MSGALYDLKRAYFLSKGFAGTLEDSQKGYFDSLSGLASSNEKEAMDIVLAPLYSGSYSDKYISFLRAITANATGTLKDLEYQFYSNTANEFPVNPKSITGMEFWFDANDSRTVSIATGVSQWSDKSGNGYHATQATGANQPTYTIAGMNGRNVLTFVNENQQYMLFNGSMKPNTLVMVWKSSVTPWATYNGVLTARSTMATVTSNGTYSAGMQGVIATTNICGIGQSSVSAYVDGTSVNTTNFDSFATGVTASPITSAHTFIYTDDTASAGPMYYGIGVDVYDIARCLSGQIPELIGYNNAISVANIAKLQNYLKIKWGTA